MTYRPDTQSYKLSGRLPDYTGNRSERMSEQFNKRVNLSRSAPIEHIGSFRQGFTAALAYVDSRIKSGREPALTHNELASMLG